MAKKIQLNIPEPCHENWQQMTPSEKGRFCGACEKQVIDFTGMSDAQLVAFFKKPATGSVCGRFLNDQLQRDIQTPKKRIPWIKYFFQILLPAFLMSARAQAQAKISKGDTVLVQPADLRMGKIAMPTAIKELPPHPYTLKGRVTDEYGNAVVGASVVIKGTNIVTTVDRHGNFMLTVPGLGYVLTVSCISFQSQELPITTTAFREGVELRLTAYAAGEVMVGDVVVVAKPKKKKKPIPLIPTRIMDTVSRYFKVFPNPVASGASINIELKEKVKEGYFILELLTATGTSVYRKEIWIDGEARVMNLAVPTLSPGNYLLSLASKDSKKRHTEQMIVVSAD